MHIDPSGHFTEDAIYKYLLQYYEGDENAARNTLRQWKKDEKWWEMITLAEGGDHLFGYQWWVEEENYTNGDSRNFMTDFLGSGQDLLIGLDGGLTPKKWTRKKGESGTLKGKGTKKWQADTIGHTLRSSNEKRWNC